MKYSIHIPAVPVAQPRQRVTVRAGHAVNYTPAKHPVNDFKAVAKIQAAAVVNAVSDAPIQLTITFVMPRPKAMVWKRRPMPRVHHTKKPDLDNLEKSLMDALTGIVWRDDSQVVWKSSTKWIAAGNEQPFCDVMVMELAG